MLYFIKRNDTLHDIARRFGRSVRSIMNQNVICDPNRIIPGIPLIIPEKGEIFPLTGGRPYYVVQPGDTLQCLAVYFNTTVKKLIESNHLSSSLQVGRELLVGRQNYHPKELFEMMKKAAETEDSCSNNTFQELFYRASYKWEAIGDAAIPYLAELLKHSCDGLRNGVIESLGRIASTQAQNMLQEYIRKGYDPKNMDFAKLALKRIDVVQRMKNKRFHVTTNDWIILQEPKSGSLLTHIPKGSVVIGLRWNFPSPYHEEGPKGGIAIFDFIKIVETGETGFFPRVGNNAIWMI